MGWSARLARHSPRMPKECRSDTTLNTVAQTSGFIQFTSVREPVQLFSLEGQFRTTDIGVMADFNCVLMRNFCPSRLTS